MVCLRGRPRRSAQCSVWDTQVGKTAASYYLQGAPGGSKTCHSTNILYTLIVFRSYLQSEVKLFRELILPGKLQEHKVLSQRKRRAHRHFLQIHQKSVSFFTEHLHLHDIRANHTVHLIRGFLAPTFYLYQNYTGFISVL